MLRSLLAALVRGRRTAGPVDLDAAVAHFHAGRLADAEQIAHAVRRAAPDNAKAWNLLGGIALEQGDEAAAARLFETAAELAPLDAGILTNLAEITRRRGELDDAEALSRRALAIDPARVPALHTLALILAAGGRSAEAFECYRRLLSIAPDFAPGQAGYLFLCFLADVMEPAQLVEEHRRLVQRIVVPGRWRPLRHANVPDPDRRLRIGYVSADFYLHAASSFIEPLLAGADTAGFDVYCYASVKRPDEVTEKLRRLAGTWRNAFTHSDEQLAELIAADAIDILVDLSGHTSGNRLPVFARKPAPLQLTWFGYPGTTGLATMDYRITDALCDPPGASEALYTEKLLRLPDIMYCYQPSEALPDVAETPALRNGYVTFGGMNGAPRLTAQWIGLWSGLLTALPRSRLVLAAVPAGTTHDRLRAAFAGHGIDPARIDIHGKIPQKAFWKLREEIDIALDTYPCNGGTNTCETMWLGVPVVTYTGARYGGNRLGTSMLASVGLDELVARTTADYHAIALGLASDLPRLAALRVELRGRMRASPLTDRDRFMRHVERAYRDIWREWCAGQGR